MKQLQRHLMFAAILFDLDNTLIDRDASFCALVEATFDSAADVEQLIRLDKNGYGDRKTLFAKWHELGGEKISMPQFGTLLAGFVERNEKLLSSLRELGSSIPLGIISNGGVSTQEAKWQAAGLNEVIPRSRFLISQELGIAKPDPAIFRLACKSMSASPEDCLFVGDQSTFDVEGSQAAGMKTQLATSPLVAEQVCAFVEALA